jgi:hypothetical protein
VSTQNESLGWSLLSPEGQPQQSAFSVAARSADFGGRTVALFWNGKPGGNVFLDEVGRQISARYRDVRIRRIWEERPDTVTSYGNTPQNLEFMARSADVVIAASSD